MSNEKELQRMSNISVVEVYIAGSRVGRLALTHDSLCGFEYDADWIVNGYSISPYYLPLKSGLQIAPIAVAEVNRLLNEEKYTHDDAYDSLKSLEMFEVIQRYHNPTKSIEKAILLHNPQAGRWYANRIYETMGIIRYCERNNAQKFAQEK